MDLPVMAGILSTTIFSISTLPMLVKAARTKNISSYSMSNILLSNLGNLVHSVYIFSLPAGPIWLLHTFYLVTTALMLVWYLRYERDKAVEITLEKIMAQFFGTFTKDRILFQGSIGLHTKEEK
jgi:uncharacterized protein with PQ loop repeat